MPDQSATLIKPLLQQAVPHNARRDGKVHVLLLFIGLNIAVLLTLMLRSGDSREETPQGPISMSSNEAEDYKEQGNAKMKAGDHKGALLLYNKGIEIQPDHAMILSNRALCYHKLGYLNEALSDAKKVVKLKPDFFKGYLRGALVLRELKRPVEAMALLESLPGSQKNDETKKLLLELRPEAEKAAKVEKEKQDKADAAEEQFCNSNPQGVLNQCNSDINDKPDDSLALWKRSICHYKLGKYQESLQDAQRAMAVNPKDYKGFLRAGMALRELGKPQDAMKELEKAPGHEKINELLTKVRPEAEKAEARRIAGLDPADRMKEEANILVRDGQHEQAIPKYTKILQTYGASASMDTLIACRNNRAACNHQLQNFEAVMEDTNWVLERQPENLKALQRRMIALEPMEKYKKCLEDAEKILALDPQNQMAYKIRTRMKNQLR